MNITAICRAVCAAVTAVSNVWTMVFFAHAIVANTVTMVCANHTAFLIRQTIFQVVQKIVTGFATMVCVSLAIVSDTWTAVCVVSTAVADDI